MDCQTSDQGTGSAASIHGCHRSGALPTWWRASTAGPRPLPLGVAERETSQGLGPGQGRTSHPSGPAPLRPPEGPHGGGRNPPKPGRGDPGRGGPRTTTNYAPHRSTHPEGRTAQRRGNAKPPHPTRPGEPGQPGARGQSAWRQNVERWNGGMAPGQGRAETEKQGQDQDARAGHRPPLAAPRPLSAWAWTC